MKRISQLTLLLLLALPIHAQIKRDCWVIEVGDSKTGDGSGYVTLMIAEDNLEAYKQRYPSPVDGMAGVKVLCRAEIARLQAKDATPIVVGKVDLTVVTPPPPPDPTPEQIALGVFLQKVDRYRKLRDILPAANTTLTTLRNELVAELVLHSEYEDEL